MIKFLNKFFIFIAVFSIAMMLSNISSAGSYMRKTDHLEKLVIKTKGGSSHAFEVSVADTPEKMAKGLMFIKHLDADKGMLFEMNKEGVIRFWMKDTFIPLDIIFIDSNGEIKKIHENAEPQSLDMISSEEPVYAVFEINGGLSKKLGISKGDKIEHDYFKGG